MPTGRSITLSVYSRYVMTLTSISPQSRLPPTSVFLGSSLTRTNSPLDCCISSITFFPRKKMRTNYGEENSTISTKCAGRFVGVFGIGVSSLLCLSGISLCAILTTFVALSKRCSSCRSFVTDDPDSVWIFAITATALFIVSGCIIVALVFRGKRLKTRHFPFPREAVVLEIPADNLENSSKCNHLPHQNWTGLPDYFTAVQNITAVCSSEDTAANQMDLFLETPPPSYEQALETMNRLNWKGRGDCIKGRSHLQSVPRKTIRLCN